MIATKSRRPLVGIASVVILLGLPAIAAAQASTFVLPFDRTGTPGQECAQAIDPISGLPVVDANGNPVVQCHAIGAFVDPCTGQNVDVTGSTTLSISTNVTGSNQLKVSVGEVTKGNGVGWDPLQPYLVGVNPNPLTANTYSFAENQQFNTQFTINGDPTSITSSTFSDKLFMKGSKSLNNWTIKATFTIKVNGQGVVTGVTSSLTGDVCKG